MLKLIDIPDLVSVNIDGMTETAAEQDETTNIPVAITLAVMRRTDDHIAHGLSQITTLGNIPQH